MYYIERYKWGVPMAYVFRGRLCGYVCADNEVLSNARVRLYRPPDERLVRRVAARPKETFDILDDDAVEAKESRLLADTRTNEEGEFDVELDEEDHDYDGEAVEVDVVVQELPGLDEPAEDPVLHHHATARMAPARGRAGRHVGVLSPSAALVCGAQAARRLGHLWPGHAL